MKWFRAAAMAAGVMFAGAFGSAASAATFWVSNVGVVNGQLETLNISGVGGVNAAGILFTLAPGTPDGVAGDTLLVFCDDIYHTVFIANYPTPLVYTTGAVNNDSNPTPNPLSAAQSFRMGALAELGQGIYGDGSLDIGTKVNELVAIQGAIWSVEYGLGAHDYVTGDTAMTDLINGYLDATVGAIGDGSTYANGIRSTDAQGAILSQGQVIGLPTGGTIEGGVPEPATWAMMLTGFLGLGAVLRNRRRAAAVA